jgi:hypothetical protein
MTFSYRSLIQGGLARSCAVAVLVLTLGSQGAMAQDADVDALVEALALDEIVTIMREEGLAYGEQIGVEMFGDMPPADWDEVVSNIYDAEWMEDEVRAALTEATGETDLGPIIEFFTTAPGADFIDLEVSARRAMLDEEVEQMAKEAAAVAIAENSPLFQQVERFVAANELIETNVVGAMNSTYAFFLGLKDGGGFPADMSESDMLGDVWAQEPALRANTEEWVYSFLVMAYSPATPDDIEAYIAFSESESGQAANRLVFAAFDSMFDDISFALGRAAARFMATQEL